MNEDGKTDWQWIIRAEDGTVATVYNWKNGPNSGGFKADCIAEWNIGGIRISRCDHCGSVAGKSHSWVVAWYRINPEWQNADRSTRKYYGLEKWIYDGQIAEFDTKRAAAEFLKQDMDGGILG